MDKKLIAVAGAGIGGLTAAIALTQEGFSVRVFERAEELRAEGAGITLQVNAMRALQRLDGLDEALAEQGEELEEGAIYDSSGRALQQLDLTDARERFGAQGVALHRARLLDTLAEACEADVVCDAEVARVEQDSDSVRIELKGADAVEAAALVGCDGLHSTVRSELFGEEPYRYAGYTSWRGVAEATDADRKAAGEYWGVGHRFGIAPIGHGQTYWFAVANADPCGEDGPNPIDELRERFDGWAEPVDDILARTEPDGVIRTDIFDREPMEAWGEGRVTLLGDAAHPMTPNLGQGAGQAIEDAVALAEHLSEHRDDLESGLRAYEDARRERANQIVERSYRIGAVAQWESRAACAMRNFLMRLTPDRLARRQIEQMYRP